MKNAARVLNEATELAASANSWADLSNALFDPINGLVTRAYPNHSQREKFARTPEYRKIRELLARAINTHGLVEGARPRSRSGLALSAEVIGAARPFLCANLSKRSASVPWSGSADRNPRFKQSEVGTLLFKG